MSGKIKVTHNGQPSGQGGFLLGYAIPDEGKFIPAAPWMTEEFLRRCGIPVGSPKLVEQKEDPLRTADGKIRWEKLTTAGYWGDCTSCGAEDTRRTMLETTAGRKAVVTCLHCGQLMKSSGSY